MKDIATGGRTVLFVSHNMAAISMLCDSCIYLVEGQIKISSFTNEVINYYLTEACDLNNQISLEKRTDRKGSAYARFTSIEVCDANTLMPLSTVLSGQDILFKIGYKVDPQQVSIHKVTIGIQIFSANGLFLTAMNNQITRQIFASLTGEGHVYCKMIQCPLMTGTHYITVVMNAIDGLVDIVEQAMVLYVETGDFYGTGIVNAQGRQGIFINYDWTQ